MTPEQTAAKIILQNLALTAKMELSTRIALNSVKLVLEVLEKDFYDINNGSYEYWQQVKEDLEKQLKNKK